MDGASRPGKVMLRDSPGMAAQVHLSKNPKLGSVRFTDTCGEGSYAVTVAPQVTHEPEETHIFSRNFLGLLCFLWIRSGWLVGVTVLRMEPRAELVIDKWLSLRLTLSPGVFPIVPLLGRTRNQVERTPSSLLCWAAGPLSMGNMTTKITGTQGPVVGTIEVLTCSRIWKPWLPSVPQALKNPG